ncbi:hypothetical protein PIB30_050205, partial [Stylosanthes scabra]|nr:hypothetical protein [Stylosanthes scabra]
MIFFQPKVGREKEFQLALRTLRGKDADISHEAQEILDYIETLQSLPKAKLLDLFQSKYMSSLVGFLHEKLVPFTALGAILMDKSGRRPLITVSASGTFLGCCITGIAFYFKGPSLLLEWVPILAVAGVLIYVAAFAIELGSVPWVIMSEAAAWRTRCSSVAMRGSGVRFLKTAFATEELRDL